MQLSLITDIGMNQLLMFFVLPFHQMFYKDLSCPLPHRYTRYKDYALECTFTELRTVFNATYCNTHRPYFRGLILLTHIVNYWAKMNPSVPWLHRVPWDAIWKIQCSEKKSQNNSGLTSESHCFWDSYRMILECPFFLITKMRSYNKPPQVRFHLSPS